MYLTGETFSYEINDDEKEFTVIGDAMIKGKEYIIAENEDNKKVAFLYDDDTEELMLVEDRKHSEMIVKYWQEEYYGTMEEVDIWEEDYNERDEDMEALDGFYIDEEDFAEEEEDYNSYIEDLMDDNDDDNY